MMVEKTNSALHLRANEDDSSTRTKSNRKSSTDVNMNGIPSTTTTTPTTTTTTNHETTTTTTTTTTTGNPNTTENGTPTTTAITATTTTTTMMNVNGNGSGEDDVQSELRAQLMQVISTIRVKLDIIEADVEQVNTLEELMVKRHYLSVLHEVTRILSLFPRSDGYEAKEIPESFSGKPRLIAFRNNMNFMLWENNSKLHLIHDYTASTIEARLALVLNVVNPIKEALSVVGDEQQAGSSPRLGGVGDTGSIVAHLNEFAERRWAERGRQVVRPARYSATTFAGSSRKFMEKMRLKVDYTLENLHNSGNLDESFLFDSPSPAGTRFARSPSASSIPVPVKQKNIIPRKEVSNNNLPLPRFALSPFTPDYSRPYGYSWSTYSSPRGHVPVSSASIAAALVSPPQSNSSSNPKRSSVKGPLPADPLRRSSSFQGDYSSPSVVRSSPKLSSIDPSLSTSSSSLTHKSTPSSPTSQSPPASPGLLRCVSLSKDFSQTILNANNEAGQSTIAYPSSPPPSPPPSPPQAGTSLAAKRKVPQLESLRLDRSSSTISSTSPSPTSSFRLDFTPNEDERDDPFDYRSVQHLPSFNVDSTIRTTPPSSPHPTSTSLPSRFSYALLSPTLPPHPYPPFSRQKQRASIAVNEQTFRKIGEAEATNPPLITKPELDRSESDRLLRRSSSDSIRVPSGTLRPRYLALGSSQTISESENPNSTAPGSRLKFEMDAPFDESQPKAEPQVVASKPKTPPSPTLSSSNVLDGDSGIRPKDNNSGPLSPQQSRRFTHARKRNMSISFAFRQLLGKGDRQASSQASPSNSPPMGKVEEAIMSRAASFKSDWLCPVVITPGYRIDMGSTNAMELPTCMNIMDLDLDISYYHNEFVGSEHYNFLGTVRGVNGMPGKPVGVSVKFIKGGEKSGEITALVRSIERDERFTIAIQPNLLNSNTPSRKRLVKLLQKKIAKLKDAQLEEIRDPKLNIDFEKFEAQQRVTKYKFGVLYCAEDQFEENEIYSNVDPSPDFAEFLQVLGTSIELEGWPNFRGGLDVKTNTTGTHSVYTHWNDYEIMFHVAPLLPFHVADEQRVERKRHIGNDIVVLIFKDGMSPINPTIFKSHFNHVFMIVQKDHAKSDVLTHYRVTFSCKDEVPVFGPMYPHSYSFPNTPKFREFILTKLVNSERSAMHTPVFFSKTKRTRQELLLGFAASYASKKS